MKYFFTTFVLLFSLNSNAADWQSFRAESINTTILGDLTIYEISIIDATLVEKVKVFDVGGDLFKVQGRKIFDEKDQFVNLLPTQSFPSEEFKIKGFLHAIGKGDSKVIKIYTYSSGLTDCNDCYLNRYCALNQPCENKCNHNAGYKCCKNEYGSTCQRD